VGDDRPVLVTRRLPDACMARLERSVDVTLYDGLGAMPRDDLLRDVSGKVGAVTLLTDHVDDEFLDAAGGQLVIAANYAVGFDNIDVEACSRRGVLASNTPGVLTETTADTAWALMMAAARRIPEGERLLRSRTEWIWGPLMLLGQDLHGSTLGLVGFGRIGQAMARRAKGFGMRVVYYDVYPPPQEVVDELDAEYRALDDLLAEADFVSLHTNLTDETRHLIDDVRLGRMKPTAVLVNTSRGPVIDEAALAEALRDGVIFAAGLDVFEREPEVHPGLLELDNVVIIPHLGSATVKTREAMGMLAIDNLLMALEGLRPPTLLDPAVWDEGRARAVRRD
jgi:glyoxylate reductase